MSERMESLGLTLGRLLKDRVLVSPKKDGSIVLQERSANMEVAITNASYSLIAINVKRLNHLSMIKDGECRKICDYLLIAELEGQYHASFVELKKTMNQETDHREQLRRSLPILEYLRSVWEVEHQRDSWSEGATVRYNLIAKRQHPRIDKQRVRRTPRDWPEVETYKDIEVRKFVGSRLAASQLLK